MVAYKSSTTTPTTGWTETSGAALTLLCPAVVAANDILIAHVIHLNTTTEPTKPADWELLYGPADLGVPQLHRAWVYGKIASGTEDGTAVNFGTAGGTSGRYGRIYSFDGYASGTIFDVVPAASFSDIPSETSIPLPSVSTSQAGALAVALLAQDDNNAFAAATGESGGSWTEPVAEAVSTTIGAQGCVCGIQVCTPTGDPGTVSGGTANATADEGSSIGFEIRASLPVNQDITPAPVTVTATAGSLVLDQPQPVNPAAVTVTVTPGALVVTPPPQGATPASVTVTVTPGVLTARREEQIAPGAVIVTATPGVLIVTVVVLLDPTTVTVTPGTLTIGAPGPDQPVAPAAVTVDVTPGLLTIAIPSQDVAPAAVSITVSPGVLSVVPESQVDLAAGSVAVSPGTVVVTVGDPFIDAIGAVITVTPGTLFVLRVRKTKWKAQLEGLRWVAALKRSRHRHL
jgi:hypothetical protein